MTEIGYEEVQAKALVADLDLSFLNKDKFEDALESIIIGAHDFFSSFMRRARLNEVLGENKSWEMYIIDHITETLAREVW